MSTRRLIETLGYAGLIPFYVLALAVWFPGNPLFDISGRGFVLYGVVILAFLGGTLWGYAVKLKGGKKQLRLVLSNLVALFAAGAGLLGNLFLAALLLAIGQILVLAYERSTTEIPGWYLGLRTRLVLGVMPAYLVFLWGWWLTG